MLDSTSPDKVVDLASSVSFEAALRHTQSLSSLTGGKLEVICAGVGGLLTFILTLMVFCNRRPRSEVLQAWSPKGSDLTEF